MAKDKNCPNCGAVYEMDKDKCPYCGTSYFDMSAINFIDNEPFYLKIKTVLNDKPVCITQLVRPSLSSIEQSCETVYEYNGFGNKPTSFTKNRSTTTNICFQAIPDKNNNLIVIQVDE